MGILLCIVYILFIAACIGAIVLGIVFYCKSKRSNTPAAKTPTAPVRSSPVKTAGMSSHRIPPSATNAARRYNELQNTDCPSAAFEN